MRRRRGCRWRRGGINKEREKNRKRRRRRRVGGRRKQVWLPRSQDFPSCTLADKYSHFPKNKSNFPATNKYGCLSLLNWLPRPPAAAWSQDSQTIWRNCSLNFTSFQKFLPKRRFEWQGKRISFTVLAKTQPCTTRVLMLLLEKRNKNFLFKCSKQAQSK